MSATLFDNKLTVAIEFAKEGGDVDGLQTLYDECQNAGDKLQITEAVAEVTGNLPLVVHSILSKGIKLNNQ